MRRCIVVLSLIVAMLGSLAPAISLAAGAKPQGKSSLRLTLPKVCYAVVNVPTSIYYDNVVLTEKPEDFRFAIDADLGTTESRRWTVTPEARHVGDHLLKLSVSDGQGKRIQQGELRLHVVPADAGAGRSLRLLIVGDSLTSTPYPNEIARLLSLPGNPSWTMLGTHRLPGAKPGVIHEGYGGWTWASFATRYEPKPDPVKYKFSSPFVFPTDGGKPRLDMVRYFEKSCQGQRPDLATFLLGINDCFGANPEDPSAIDARIDTMFAQAEILVAAFRKAAPEAELGICLTTPPNSRESGFEANYHGRYHRWGWKRIQHRLVERQLKQFGNREAQRIFIVPTELNLDPVDGYPVNNGVHPNALGYQQIGDSIFAWIKFRMQEKQTTH